MKRSIKELIKNGDYIEGIYNYCDRWCERCTYSSRCLNYSIDQEKFGDVKEKDISNEEFWKGLQEIFSETNEMIRESIREMGGDPDSLPDEEIPDIKTEDRFLVKLARKYSEDVRNWFEDPLYVSEKESILLEEKRQKIDEIAEVIFWYQHQIEVKFRRAFFDLGLNDSEEKFGRDDSNGSVKVALIGIDRSIGAWGKLLHVLPQREKSILQILYLLERIKDIAEKSFPKARSFIRPGFDE